MDVLSGLIVPFGIILFLAFIILTSSRGKKTSPFEEKRLQAFHSAGERGNTPYLAVVGPSDYKEDTYFAEFEAGKKRSRETYDFVDYGGALAFTQSWYSHEESLTRFRRIVSIPLARDFGDGYVQVERERDRLRKDGMTRSQAAAMLPGATFGKRDYETDSIAFNEKFYVTGSSKELTVTALAPRVQNLLKEELYFSPSEVGVGSVAPMSVGFRTGAVFVSWASPTGLKEPWSIDVFDYVQIEKQDVWFADWLGEIREALESVTGPQVEGDAFAVAPVSREFLEAKAEQYLEKSSR